LRLVESLRMLPISRPMVLGMGNSNRRGKRWTKTPGGAKGPGL
jgi:hypothetical protein